MQNKITLLVTIGLSTLFMGVGCGNVTLNYESNTQPMATAWAQGDYQEANKQAGELIDGKLNNEKNSVVLNLEHGMTLRAAEQYKASNAAFQKALNRMNKMENDSTASKGAGEVAAVLSNLNVMPYRGFSYDRIMAHTCKALNHLALGSLEDARLELNKAYQAQADAVTENEDRIAQDEKKVQEAQKGKREELKNTDLGDFNNKIDEQLAEVLKNLPDINPAYGPYVNPFTEYMQGLFLTRTGQDIENGTKSLRRVLAMSGGNNKHVAADVTNPNDNQALTYVIFENGVAPFRKENLVVLVIPVPVEYVDENGVKQTKIVHVKIAFSWPTLEESEAPSSALKITADGKSMDALEVADMDSVVAMEFKNRWPGMRNRIILSNLIKVAGAIYATKEFGMIGGIVGSIHQEVTKHTDTRTWRTLPKNFKVCRFATPADRKVTLSLDQSSWNPTIDLIKAEVNVIFVKRTGEGSIPILHQFKLK